MGEEVSENLRELVLDQELEAHFIASEGDCKMIELFLKGKTKAIESVNAKLISHGYAKLI